MSIGAPGFREGANGSFVVRMDQQVDVPKLELNEEVVQEFNHYCLEPADIASGLLPALSELEGVPVTADDDAETPRGRGVHIYVLVPEWTNAI